MKTLGSHSRVPLLFTNPTPPLGPTAGKGSGGCFITILLNPPLLVLASLGMEIRGAKVTVLCHWCCYNLASKDGLFNWVQTWILL